jgi:prophage regulatory protein
MKIQRLLKKKDILQLCAISHSTLYRMIKKGTFPEPVALTGGRSVAWREDDIAHWIDTRPRIPLARIQLIDDGEV